MKKILLSVLLIAAWLSMAFPAQLFAGIPGPAAAVESTPEVRQKTFEIVWRTVKEKHFDPTLGGIDWDKVRDQYAPRVEAAKTDHEFYGVLQQMLGELHQSHFSIIPPEAIVDDGQKAPQIGGIGVDIRMIDGQAMITHVEGGSTGEAAGLRTGFVVQRIDNTAITQISSQFARSSEPAPRIRLRLTRAVMARIDGGPGTTVRITYLDGNDQPRDCSVARVRLKGEMSPRFGNFPPQYTEFEAKRLDRGIGYIRFNIFVMPLMERIRAAIRSMSDATGIIIDLRGNPGGVGGMAAGIAGVMETRSISLGVMKMREGHANFLVIPQGNPYQGPVVILTDGGSASTSEIFAAGLQESNRAVVVGERTTGAALPSLFQKLPTGALLQYAIGDFRTPKGVLIEGQGVAPNVEVKMDRRALLAGHDPQLEAAIEQVLKQAQHQRAASGR